jgi:hypothetical protein
VARRKLNVVKAVKGKVVERIVIHNDEYINIDIQFEDNTSLDIQLNAAMRVDRVDLIGWKKGNSRVLKNLL